VLWIGAAILAVAAAILAGVLTGGDKKKPSGPRTAAGPDESSAVTELAPPSVTGGSIVNPFAAPIYDAVAEPKPLVSKPAHVLPSKPAHVRPSRPAPGRPAAPIEQPTAPTEQPAVPGERTAVPAAQP
jgi:hypothetical protein